MSGDAPRPTLVGLELGDSIERWEALGFNVVDGAIELAGVQLVLGATSPGINRWTLAGIDPVDEIDGVRTAVVPPRQAAPTQHPNGAVALDHVVITTPDFDRTAALLELSGIPLRRVRDAGGFRQGFRRLGPGILELVEAKQMPAGPARFWGLVVVLRDLSWLTGHLDQSLTGGIKPAVQPGRQIVTLKRSAGLGQAIAFMSPEPA